MTEDREEKPQLKPANESPWYCLATLYGEQPGEYNHDLANRNRIAWNRWVAGALTEEYRAGLAAKRFPAAELVPLTEAEQEPFLQAFQQRALRAGKAIDLPKADEQADFARLHFKNIADFSGFLFSKVANFEFSRFSASANFRSVTFLDYADFSAAHFSAPSEFIDATFSASADFREAIFRSSVDFKSVIFLNRVNFISANFCSFVGFDSAIFSVEADFLTAKFGEAADFSNAIFKSNVPDFRGATLHEATEWDDARWPDPPSDMRWPFTVPTKGLARRQVYAYQRLKQEMEKLKKHEDELFFFGKELRAKRGTLRLLLPNWWLNALYQFTSNYGASVGRPLVGLMLLYVLVSIFFAKVNLVNCKPLSWPHAWGLSFANVFPFLSLRKDFLTPVLSGTVSHALFYVSAGESILAGVLLFLFGLGLRNRFRIK